MLRQLPESDDEHGSAVKTIHWKVAQLLAIPCTNLY